MNNSVVEHDTQSAEVLEIRITSGIAPNEVEDLLDMAATSGMFDVDELMSIEDLAYNCAYQNDGNTCRFFLAKSMESGSERPVGFICFGAIPHWPHDHELFGIAVSAQYQRLGIGTALISEMERKVKACEGRHVFVEISQSSAFDDAREFCEAIGFVQESRYRKQFTPKDGGYIYRIDIDGSGDQDSQQ